MGLVERCKLPQRSSGQSPELFRENGLFYRNKNLSTSCVQTLFTSKIAGKWVLFWKVGAMTPAPPGWISHGYSNIWLSTRIQTRQRSFNDTYWNCRNSFSAHLIPFPGISRVIKNSLLTYSLPSKIRVESIHPWNSSIPIANIIRLECR